MDNVGVVRRWADLVQEWLDSGASPEQLEQAISECFAEDVEFHPARKMPDAELFRGRDEFVRFMERFIETWAWQFVIETLTAVGDDGVLARGMLRARGRASEIDASGELFECYWVRDGRITRLEHHVTPQGALAAFGA